MIKKQKEIIIVTITIIYTKHCCLQSVYFITIIVIVIIVRSAVEKRRKKTVYSATIVIIIIQIGTNGCKNRFRRKTLFSRLLPVFAYYYVWYARPVYSLRSVYPRESCWQIGGSGSISIIETISYTEHDRE